MPSSAAPEADLIAELDFTPAVRCEAMADPSGCDRRAVLVWRVCSGQVYAFCEECHDRRVAEPLLHCRTKGRLEWVSEHFTHLTRL